MYIMRKTMSLFLALFFAISGLIQLIKTKNLLKVDHEILMTGIIYAIVIILYILFEKLAINYRPVVLDKGLEASFPSTHTMVILSIAGTAIPVAGKYFKHPLIIKIFSIAVMWLTIICRLLSGVHWFTDIIGGVLISLCLISLFKTLVRR